MTFTERHYFAYFIAGILPSIACFSRNDSIWTIIGIVWLVGIGAIMYVRNKK